MELDSFKTLLLKKSEGNKDLQTLIEYIGIEFLIPHVIDALEKMAGPTTQTGKNANGPVTTYGAHLDKSDVHQLRDALSHHVSHYKAALKAHHATTDEHQKKQLRGAADQHLNHLIPLMHLAARAGAHSGGKLALDYTKLPAWETNYSTLDRRPETGKFKLDTEKLHRRPSPNARQWHPDNKENRGIRNYHYLEMPPHSGHNDAGKMPHKGGYPWEEVQVGSPADIDAKKAYLHVEDVPDKKQYTPHPFDKHPIREVQDTLASHLTPERLQRFATDLAGWKNSEHHKQWMNDQRAKMQADPEGYKKRGSVKPSHVYEGIPLQDQLGHVKLHQEQALSNRTQSRSATSDTTPTATDAPVVPENLQAADAQPADDPAMENMYNVYLSAPAKQKMKLLNSSDRFAQYLNRKGVK